MNVLCNSCKIEVERSNHYNSLFHRYNVKRKCAGLAPVSEAAFQSVLQASKKTGSAPVSPSSQKTFQCEPCSKTFRSKASLDSHLRSAKHKKAAAAFVKPSPAVKDEDNADVDIVVHDADDGKEDEVNAMDTSNEPQPIPLGSCLFCSKSEFETLQGCIDHMTSQHGFFIPCKGPPMGF